jgi:Domain of unknown function (DUF4397)
MSRRGSVVSLLILCGVAACDSNPAAVNRLGGQPALRIINAFTAPVDVLVDGQVAVSGMAVGAIDTIGPSLGAHTLTLRASGASSAQSITTAAGALNTVAVVRSSSGSVGSAVLDDTNSVVPAGATKVRVIHLAPNAGTLQVYRTQPDYGTPISWQFPFNYQPDPNSLSAPFFQSTVGTWEVRIWQTPTDASGWSTAPVKVVIPLASGEKRTILMLDKVGGGVRVEVI